MKKIKVRVDQSTCIQCGTCYSALTDIFMGQDDGTAQVQENFRDVIIEDPDLIEKILQVRDMCPSQSIIVEEVE
ncbi:MAG: ferredoxin [bacterium]